MHNGMARFARPSRNLVITVRVASYFTIGALIMLIPAVGENRYLVGGLLIAGAIPTSIFLALKLHTSDHAWVDPLVDLLLVIILVHVIPAAWYPALAIGLMITLAPSITLHPRSNLIYAGNATLFLSGISFAGWYHDVPEWWVSVSAALALYPAIIFYAHWQAQRADVLKERAQFMRNIQQLAGSVAHDFNNTLTSIGGHTELAAEQLPANHMAHEDLVEVLDGVDRARELCQELLSFSLHKGISPGLMNLDKELRALMNLLKPMLPPGVQINFSCTEPGVSIIGNRTQVQLIIMNIVLNAGDGLKAVAQPPPIEVVVSREESGERYWAVVEITDRGDGLSHQNLIHTLPSGDGMDSQENFSLTNIHRIMRENEGAIDYRRTQGETHVRLRFPLAPTRPEVPTFTPIAANGTAMVVDDEPQIRNVASRMLAAMNFDVRAVSGADQAIAEFQRLSGDVSVVLLDLRMPGKGGWACAHELRELDPDLPIVIMSGFDPDASTSDALQPPIYFLEKPFRRIDLQHALGSVLGAPS